MFLKVAFVDSSNLSDSGKKDVRDTGIPLFEIFVRSGTVRSFDEYKHCVAKGEVIILGETITDPDARAITINDVNFIVQNLKKTLN